MGSILLGGNDDSDDESCKTPPETVDTESKTEHNDNPNTPEISEDELENDLEVEELLNNPENDTAMDLHKFCNYPDILDLKTGQNTSDSDKDESDSMLKIAPFLVETDSMSVKYIRTLKTMKGVYVPWSEIIKEFTFTVIHAKVMVEDCISREP